MGKLLLCIDKGYCTKGWEQPIEGVVYKLERTYERNEINRVGHTWYKVEGNPNIHCPSLFEELSDDFLTNLQTEKIEEKLLEVSKA